MAVACLDDAVLSQLVQLQVAEGFPGADDGDVWGEERGCISTMPPPAWPQAAVPAESPVPHPLQGGGGGHRTPVPVPSPSMPGMSSPNLQGERASALTPSQPPPTPGWHVRPRPPTTGALPWVPGLCPTHPCTPFLGGLLLNCLVCLCLNLGGPFRGVAGPPVTLVADLISGLGGSRLMAGPRPAACPGSRLSLWVRRWRGTAPHT